MTALQRYRETATLLDHLTYTNAATSNRLTSVTDAIAGSAEPWDAETGAFTYDANGNLLTAPAPYALTNVTYDGQNLPLTITRSGITTAYRYDAAGLRVTKQVGGGATEVYVLDGATTLGVVTVNGAGTPTSWLFNVLAGERVVGRQPNVGARRYYHTDLLGSTRAVVEGATVVESYDADPWGLLLPGRTLGSGTKEGFTGKERDLESGMDYFGARYYLPALGRWGAVDPLGQEYPQWSSYNYVLNNPLRYVDPNGRFASPVYDRDGNLLGTDDEGLKGQAIVMEKKKFVQGMSHAEASKNNLGADGLNSADALSALESSYRSLPSRPDYDGALTFTEAVSWYNTGRGQPLFVDAASLDLRQITVQDVKAAKNGSVDLFPRSPRNTGAVYGHIKFTLLDATTGEVRLGNARNRLDVYDYTPGSPAGMLASLWPGAAVDYEIYCSRCVNHVTPRR